MEKFACSEMDKFAFNVETNAKNRKDDRDDSNNHHLDHLFNFLRGFQPFQNDHHLDHLFDLLRSFQPFQLLNMHERGVKQHSCFQARVQCRGGSAVRFGEALPGFLITAHHL